MIGLDDPTGAVSRLRDGAEVLSRPASLISLDPPDRTRSNEATRSLPKRAVVTSLTDRSVRARPAAEAVREGRAGQGWGRAVKFRVQSACVPSI